VPNSRQPSTRSPAPRAGTPTRSRTAAPAGPWGAAAPGPAPSPRKKVAAVREAPKASPSAAAAPSPGRRRAERATAAGSAGSRPTPSTLAIDIGGTGLKASVLDPAGNLLVDRVRVPTPYPCPPPTLIASLVELVAPLPPFDRISAGFPGMVRAGRVLSAPHLVTSAGPGTPVLPESQRAWSGFDLVTALAEAFGKPARVENDADLQGGAVVKGVGLEVVITLGTGMGSAVYYNGLLAPHLELSQHPFRKGQTYDEQLGDEARRKIGNKKWSKRVAKAAQTIDALLLYDHLFIGGGNAPRLTIELGPRVSLVDNIAGIAGGIKLWAPTGG
jgi:polyphosphate glucokinase